MFHAPLLMLPDFLWYEFTLGTTRMKPWTRLCPWPLESIFAYPTQTSLLLKSLAVYAQVAGFMRIKAGVLINGKYKKQSK